MATTEALRHPGIEWDRPFIQPFKQWYSRQIYQQSVHDPELYMRLVQVMNVIRSPTHLFHPKVGRSFLKKGKESIDG